MNHLHRHIPHPCQPLLRPRQRLNRKLFLIPLAGLLLAGASCTRQQVADPPPIPVTDTKPVGEGLKVIGFAMLGAAVVVVLGRLIR